MLTVACVLRSGGYYTPAQVVRFRNNLHRYINSTPYRLVCLTDLAEDVGKAIAADMPDIHFRAIPLRHDWDGWWAKMELFSLAGPILYFDLDTLIVNDIDSYAEYVMQMNADTILALEGFVDSTYGVLMSGVMGWNSDLGYVYDLFKKDALPFMSSYRGDQNVIEYIVKNEGVELHYIQRELKGTYSYKRSHIRKRGLPDDAKIVCFHGKPRPEQCRDEWVQNVLARGEA